MILCAPRTILRCRGGPFEIELGVRESNANKIPDKERGQAGGFRLNWKVFSQSCGHTTVVKSGLDLTEEEVEGVVEVEVEEAEEVKVVKASSLS